KGLLKINVSNVGEIKVLCEGNWTVVLRRINGTENFYRGWSNYTEGFGDLDAEFFIGLEALHQMTTSERYELRIELMDFYDNVRDANYNNFIIGSKKDDYNLKSLGSYTGTAGNALQYNLGEKFTTIDRDNDDWSGGNCAVYYGGAGWYAWYANR
ncbi:hypothetical protein KR093_008803, partial [Drosophila rubida]